MQKWGKIDFRSNGGNFELNGDMKLGPIKHPVGNKPMLLNDIELNFILTD